MKVELNSTLYEMSDARVKDIITEAKKVMGDCNCIVGIEKDGLLIMTKSKYTSKTKLKNAIREYKANGYKVHSKRAK